MKATIITGTSSGIGHKLALHLLGQGQSVIGCSRRESKIGDANYQHYKLDLTDEKAVSGMFFDMSTQGFDSLALINNAGCANMNHFLLAPRASGDEMLRVNTLAATDCMRHYAKLLIKKRVKSGRILNFSSVAVARNLAGQLWYAASKSALESATKIASKELADMNVTVNCIRLPYFRTRMSGAIGKDRVEEMINNQTIKRNCSFTDISNVVDFLLSDASDFITGELISLGGNG